MFHFLIGAALLGMTAKSVVDQNKANKQAKTQANQQMAENAKQADMLRKEQGMLSAKASAARNKLNAGIARGNKRRVKGGLFGDAITPPTMTDKLG